MSISENEYRDCDHCLRECPVDLLRCENGAGRYKQITGEEYPHAVSPTENTY